MRYNYDSNLECFVREDGLGKKLWINSVEGQRIMTLHKLGNSISEIRNKITFNSRKVRESTIEAFIRNVKNGDIIIPSDAPMPVNESLTVEERIQKLEDDFETFKQMYFNQQDSSVTSKIRGLFNHG